MSTCVMLRNVVTQQPIKNILFGCGNECTSRILGFRQYAKDKGGCCKDVSQTTPNKVIEDWPKPFYPASKPPVNDLYRIRVADVMVPPLPKSSKRRGILLSSKSEDESSQQYKGSYHQSGNLWNQSNRGWNQHPHQQGHPEEKEEEGLWATLKKIFTKPDKCAATLPKAQKAWNIEVLPATAIACKIQGGPCSKELLYPPACIPPPKKPFPWIIPMIIGVLMSIAGVLYRYCVYMEEQAASNAKEIIWRPRPKDRRPTVPQDLPECVQYLIIGAGIAGWAATKAILEHDKDAKVMIISLDDSFPYKRYPMATEMWWNREPPDINTLAYMEDRIDPMSMYQTACTTFMELKKFFRRKKGPAVGIALGYLVRRVDPEDHTAWICTYCGLQPMYYERALIATGSKARQLPFYKYAPKKVRNKVLTLRTIRDLEIAYRKVVDAKHVTIVGGGPLGTELAYYIGTMHKNWDPPKKDYVPPQVTFVIQNSGILANILPQYLGEWALEKLKCIGIQAITNCQVYDGYMTKDDRLELTLSNGKNLTTDVVLVAIGADPNTDIALNSNLELDDINGGIEVNTELEARTHLYVAGDVASVYNTVKNSRVRLQHHMNAVEQGQLAGRNMTGWWGEWIREQQFQMVLGHDMKLEAVGDVGACLQTIGLFKPCDRLEDKAGLAYEKSIGEYEKPCFKSSDSYRNRYKKGMIFYVKDNIVVGVVFWNYEEDHERVAKVTEILRARPEYEQIDVIAELLGFGEIECVIIPPVEDEASRMCMDMSKSNWHEYKENERLGLLGTGTDRAQIDAMNLANFNENQAKIAAQKLAAKQAAAKAKGQ